MQTISFVIPCYNEEQNIPEVYAAVMHNMENFPQYQVEFIFLDNASQDNSEHVLRELAERDKRVHVILNNRNFGPENSIFYGILQANGAAIIYLACDLQDPPSLIPQFLNLWERGQKVIWGQKTGSDESRCMYCMRTLYYTLIGHMSSITQYPHVTGFGLYDKRVVDDLRCLNDPWPMLRNIIPDLGYRPVLIPYQQPQRKRGKSSYTIFRYFNTALNSLVHTSQTPLKLAIYLGLATAFVSLAFGLFYLIYKLLYWNEFSLGMAPMIICTFFVAAVQLIFLGILGEYVLAVLSRISFVRHVYERERINFAQPQKKSPEEEKE